LVREGRLHSLPQRLQRFGKRILDGGIVAGHRKHLRDAVVDEPCAARLIKRCRHHPR